MKTVILIVALLGAVSNVACGDVQSPIGPSAMPQIEVGLAPEAVVSQPADDQTTVGILDGKVPVAHAQDDQTTVDILD